MNTGITNMTPVNLRKVTHLANIKVNTWKDPEVNPSTNQKHFTRKRRTSSGLVNVKLK